MATSLERLEPVGERCLCSHLIETHDLGIRGGQKVRTKCSHWGCGCREYRPERHSEEEPE